MVIVGAIAGGSVFTVEKESISTGADFAYSQLTANATVNVFSVATRL